MSIDHDSVTDNQEPDARGVYREIVRSTPQKPHRNRRKKENHQAETAGIYYIEFNNF
ncbi:MAG: hypothetical protein JW891_18605 [Candidatus Lokiarchaeota archaeon]|nr:hypothetical protein [Candidatus Lokiarchaeota archaeon]